MKQIDFYIFCHHKSKKHVEKISGYKYKGFAIHKTNTGFLSSYCKWTATHLESGIRVKCFDYKKDVMEFLNSTECQETITKYCESEEGKKLIAEFKALCQQAESEESLCTLHDIAFLLAEIDRLQDAQRWIPVAAKKPERNQSAIAYAPPMGQFAEHMDITRGFMVAHPKADYTHWMPKPTPPEVPNE